MQCLDVDALVGRRRQRAPHDASTSVSAHTATTRASQSSFSPYLSTRASPTTTVSSASPRMRSRPPPLHLGDASAADTNSAASPKEASSPTGATNRKHKSGSGGIMARASSTTTHPSRSSSRSSSSSPRWLFVWRRHCFDAIMAWERIMRWIFVYFPTFVYERIDGLNNVVSFFFVYVMLQALAILWGFLFNVGAILGDNMISILQMPYIQALCVLLTHASVIGIVLSFGRATWILTWQSTQNFPMIRRIIAYECRPQSVILVLSLPMLLLLPNLILVPSACASLVLPDDGSNILASSSWAKTLCEETYLKFLTDRHPIFQRALRLATAIAIWQFIQACLEILPRWRGALTGMSTRATFLLAGLLLALNAAGLLWWVEWIARHFQYNMTPLSAMTPLAWEIFGMSLLTAWILWFLLLSWQTSHHISESDASQKKLIGLFERLKYSFVIGQAIIFFRACLHPSMGFVHAQLELTIINLLLPSIYVISLIMLRMVSLLSVKVLTMTGPVTFLVAAAIYKGSKMTQRPHSFVVLFIFLFEMSLRWSEAVNTLRRGRVPVLLQEMLRKTTSETRKPPLGHGTVKKIVYLASFTLFLFVAVMAGFSVLSVLQQNSKWFPDGTSLQFHNQSAIEIRHTAIVKLHLGLVDETQKNGGIFTKAMHVEDPRYASCANKWHGLSLVDFALFAEAAYFDPVSKDVEKFISSLFGKDLPNIEIRVPILNSKTGSKLDFYEAFIPSLNTSVISVRGTDIWRFTDFIEDVKMFVEPVIFSILSAVFPTIRIWPDVTFSTLIELYSEMISLFGLQHEFWYYHELLEYVQSIKDRDVVLTGHSMGGGIAKLVGSIVGKTSITFSPPGFVQSYSKLVHDISGGKALKVDRNSLHHRSVAVVPEYDPVTLIDAQAGMIQKISCDTPHLSMQLSCHMLEGTLCNLLDNCGDPRGRIASCQFEHKITSLTDDLFVKLTAVLHPELLVTLVLMVSIVLSIVVHQKRRPTLQAQFLTHGPSSKGRPPSPSPAAQRRHHHRGRQTVRGASQSQSPPRRKSII